MRRVLLESIIQIIERPRLKDPVLIEGLPGTGFVANIAALHLIKTLRARKFAEIRSPFFQNLAILTENGDIRFPINELYYHKTEDFPHDLIILYGNAQALTTYGQYELYGKILDVAQEFGCRSVFCIDGLRSEPSESVPKLYCAATDPQTLNKALSRKIKKTRGCIFGAAGLLIGLARTRGMHGLCLLVETPGSYPDAIAARSSLECLCDILGLKVDLSMLEQSAESTRKVLESFRESRAEGESGALRPV